MDDILKYIDDNPTELAFDEFGTLCYKDSGEPFLPGV